MKFVGVLSVVASLAAMSLVGCGGGSSQGTLPDPTVRFINASPAATSMDFLLNDAVEGGNLGYLASTPDFQEYEFRSDTNEGGYDISIQVPGSTSELDRENTVFNRNTHTVVLSIGKPNPNGELEKRARIIQIPIDRTAPVGNRSRLIVFNSMLRAPSIDQVPITFQSIIPGDPASIDNPQFKLTDIQFASQQSITIDSGARTFIARRGEVDAVEEFARITFNFEPAKLYLVVIAGQESNPDGLATPQIAVINLATKN